MPTSNQKVNLNICTAEQLFKAMSRVHAKIAVTSGKDQKRIGHSIKNISDMSEHYGITADDSYQLTKLGHQSFKRWMPHRVGATKDHGKKKGLPLDDYSLLHISASTLE